MEDKGGVRITAKPTLATEQGARITKIQKSGWNNQMCEREPELRGAEVTKVCAEGG